MGCFTRKLYVSGSELKGCGVWSFQTSTISNWNLQQSYYQSEVL